MLSHKICTKCEKQKPLSEFASDKRTKSGKRSQCKECKNKYQKQYRAKNPELDRYIKIKCMYGLKQEEYDLMIKQGCLICGSKNKLHVDHCHKTNKVRGVLCHHCNVGLGYFKDNSRLLKLAANYLERKGVINS